MNTQRWVLITLTSFLIITTQVLEAAAFNYAFLPTVGHLRRKAARLQKPVTASLTKPRVNEVLRGKVVNVAGNQISVDESYTGRLRIVHLPAPVLVPNIKIGDQVRINFVKGSQKSINIVKE
jgi:hypothetical protein